MEHQDIEIKEIKNSCKKDFQVMTNEEMLSRVAQALSQSNIDRNNIDEISEPNSIAKNQCLRNKECSDIDSNLVDQKDNSVKKVFLCTPSKKSCVEEVQPPDKKKEKASHSPSVLDYLYSELRRGYLLENDEQRFTERREKFYTFFKIPREIEQFIMYGFFQCVDAFLFLFTFLPLRFALSVCALVTRMLKLILSAIIGNNPPHRRLQPAEICDGLKFLLMCAVSFAMTYVDTSMLYHIVKSQSVIKLYIIFNMLEVGDKLFSSFGQDILDALYWTATEPRGRKREHLGLLPHIFFSLIYLFFHSLLVLVQATTLNVAINSQNKALLTIMMSNNFVELKSMVFKKFEKNNLFQMSCSDVKERFHYLVLLFVVIVQTMKEYNWSYDQFMILLPYCIGVIVAELFVDWTKHAFVTRFNEISLDVYREYTISLAYDLASCKLKNAFADHSDLISRRMGFIPLPMAALVIRVVSSSIPVVGLWGCICFFLVYLSLMTAKIAMSIILLGKACGEIEMHRNAQKEKLPPPRQCNSLPSSRHHSADNLTMLDTQTKSMPQSQCGSTSSSIADITAHAELLQESFSANQLFANSTVSINSLGMNENIFTDQDSLGNIRNRSETFGGILRSTDPRKRKSSLQEITAKNLQS